MSKHEKINDQPVEAVLTFKISINWE